jgi:hypothetical protein
MFFGVGLISTDAESGVIEMVGPPANIDDPSPMAVVVEPSTAESRIGPSVVGHVSKAFGFKHNCGASPTAVTVAEAASAPFLTAKFTTNLGF